MNCRPVAYLLTIVFLFPFISSAETVPKVKMKISTPKTLSVLSIENSSWAYEYAKEALGTEIRQDVEYDEDDIVKNFTVRNNKLYDDDVRVRNEKTDDYRIWNIFAGIAGDRFVTSYIGWYATFRDAQSKTLGLVRLLDSAREPGWGLAVNANAADFENKKWTQHTTATLIHEFAHILTLNSFEVNHHKIKRKYCIKMYLSIKGCADKDAYINVFVSRFWTANDLTHKTTDKKYYEGHKDDFLTKYAVKNPEEDIAESFTEFVLNAKPTDVTKKKNQKILFFYEYPEFVQMRIQIRSNIGDYFK